MKRVLVVGLDTFAHKNRAQLDALGEHGFRFDVIANDLRGDSSAQFSGLEREGHRLFIENRGPLSRFAKVLRLLAAGRYHHAELYATGRLASLYVAALRAFRVPFVVIERGDVGFMRMYGALTRHSMKAAYRAAAVVVYKETFMKDLLQRLTGRPLAFIPNAIEVPPARTADTRRRFLWANRIIVQRRAEWLVDAFSGPALQRAHLDVVGFEARADLPAATVALQERIRGEAGANVALHAFTDPRPFYLESTFFCFPAEKVFGNNALLEAMAHGLVPVVTRAPGVELMVEDGVNGIVTEFDADAYRAGLERAFALSDDELARLSAASVATVRDRYSLARWTESMRAVYAQVGR